MNELMKKQKTAMAHHFKKTFTKVDAAKKQGIKKSPTKFSAIREEDQAQSKQPPPRQEQRNDLEVNSSHDLSDEVSDGFGKARAGGLDNTSGPSS